ncbi:helix-turn-helix domain-containing protein [Streptomyces milbemycinicus]|uniref:Helix-turn-helix domain-containing protein n=1 Tax=Streptomyces milbemycinicus TaxID=476552 RepID=A0ABW8M2R2_9ACTN
MVQYIRRAYGLRSHPQRLADQGMASLREIARRLGVCLSTVQNWRNRGLLTGRVANDKGEYFYYSPPPDLERPGIGRPPKNPTPLESTGRSAV